MMTQGVFGAKPPFPLGHEASGVIVDIGARVGEYGLKVGDNVVLSPGGSCGLCPMCKKGHRQYCRNGKHASVFAEYALTDVSGVFKVPDDGDLKAYSLTEPAQCTIRAMDLTPIPHGATVAVSGIGGIGSILLNQVILSGAAQITAIDPVPQKRELALSMGAQYVIDPFTEDVVSRSMEITEGYGFDFVFEVSGSPKAAQTPLNILAQCGTVSYFAVFPPTFELPLNLYELYMKEGRIQTVFCDPVIMPRTVSLIPRIQTDKIIGKILPLADALDALELFEESIYPKILLDCGK
jgi:(R,R)-butanediol dehydrogenase/meso-butanediol dehydrogenase/diacetyl reductase